MISPQYLTEIEERVAKATNAQLITHARTDIPALVSEVKALREALASDLMDWATKWRH